MKSNRSAPPVDAEQILLQWVADPAYQPLKLRQLARSLQVGDEEYPDFRRLVKDLVQRGLLVRMRQNRYAAPDSVPRVSGVVRIHPKGFGFVVREGAEADILVRRRNLAGAVDGDRVQVEVLSLKGWQGIPEGRVVEVEDRQAQRLLATYYSRGKWRFARPDDIRWGREIGVDEPLPEGLEDGHKIWLEVGGGAPRGRIVEVLGDPQAPALDFLRVVDEFGLPLAFPAAAETEADVAEIEAAEAPESARRDLRAWTCFTIDPPEAKDFDDALSVRALPGGSLELGVHIADVSHFVKEGGPLDLEARRRGTSVYLIDRVVPMLPPRLADELCTLAPKEDRLAFSVVMRVGAAGQVEQYEIFESLIHSRARLTYGQVQAALDGDAPPGSARGMEESLVLLEELCARLRARRWQRGALDFEIPEARVEVDPEGNPTVLGAYPRFASHRLVEECMLAANECVGRFLAEGGYPALYRVHAAPDELKLRSFSDYVRSIGVDLPRGVPPAQNLQKVLQKVEDRADRGVINTLLLRAMMRAEYSPVDSGHYGLACERYLHFTSPIRRYPDLVVHRILKEALGIRQASGRRDLEAWGKAASDSERRAQEAERAYTKTKQLRYMATKLGEKFDGRVSGFGAGGIFIEVGDTLAEGYCSLTQLDDYYELDPRTHRLVGRRSNTVIRLGDEVEVRVARVDLPRRHLDLDLIGAGRGRRDKAQRATRRRSGKGRVRRRRRR